MIAPNNNFWFRPGRLEKEGRKNPGILAVDDKYEFVAHSNNKEGTEYVYVCKFRQTVKIKCPARVRIIWNKDHWIMLTICLRLRVVTHKMFKESERLSRGSPKS